ncbi:MAG: M20/M25/M40 family metallo-hydrolase [Ruminococcaceae bacterium]|nr:M20/M25/M40 family metallo-hydrolase [Oscillospiraceae bacterium]
MIALFIILGLLVALVAILVIRTVSFRPKEQNIPEIECEDFDRENVIEALQKLIRCKTVSYYDRSLEDDAEFEKLIDMLPSLYPEVFRVCDFKQLPDRALLFKWEGKAHNEPSVMMAHYDVVPVEADKWQKPPFDAVIEDGVLWGRGSLDTKVTFNAVLQAANKLISMGFVPEQDMYFAFSGGEETDGEGAKNIVKYFVDNDIHPALVVDEGGAVVENVFPGVKQPCGLIGIAEKGMMNLKFSIQSNGGHASAPKPHTPIGVLSKACCDVENKPFPMHITKPVAELFDNLGRHSTFVFRMIFANMWLFKGVLNLICKKSGGEINALVRTTVAFTQASGSAAPNVIPPSSSMVANLRLNPEDSVATAKERIKKTVNNQNVELSVISCMEPSPISRTDCKEYDKVAAAVANTWKGCIVSPYLMVQCSDSRHYGKICDRVYRFSAMDLTAEERSTIHGHNERIRLETACHAVEFYIRLMKQC